MDDAVPDLGNSAEPLTAVNLTRIDQFVAHFGLREIPTPLAVFDFSRIKSNALAFSEAATKYFRQTSFCYPIKTCPLPDVVTFVTSLGWGVEVQSLSELDSLGNSKTAPIVFHGPGKTDYVLRTALERGAIPIADSVPELQFLSATPTGSGNFGLRVRFPIGGYYGAVSKLGVDPKEAIEALIELKANSGLRYPSWLAVHCLARESTPDRFVELGRSLRNWLQEARERSGVVFSVVNLGGGFDSHGGITRSGHIIGELLGGLAATLGADDEVRHVFEPGRFVVGDAGLVLTRVLRTKTSSGVRWAVVDASTNLLVPIPLARFCPRSLRNDGTALADWTVVDRTCSPKGVIATNVSLPSDLSSEDALVIQETGAYTYSFAQNFCNPLPATIAIGDSGIVHPLAMQPPFPLDFRYTEKLHDLLEQT